MTTVLERLDSTWKAIGIIVAAAAFGVTVTLTASGFIGMPARMERAERDIEILRGMVERLVSEAALTNCLEITEREGRNWRECLTEQRP